MLSGGITKRKRDSTGTRLETPRQHSGGGTSGPEGVNMREVRGCGWLRMVGLCNSRMDFHIFLEQMNGIMGYNNSHREKAPKRAIMNPEQNQLGIRAPIG